MAAKKSKVTTGFPSVKNLGAALAQTQKIATMHAKTVQQAIKKSGVKGVMVIVPGVKSK